MIIIVIIFTAGLSYDLHLNISKCETMSNTGVANHPSLDGFEQKTTHSAVLLGALLSTGSALTERLAARCARATERLKLTSAHDDLILISKTEHQFNTSV